MRDFRYRLFWPPFRRIMALVFHFLGGLRHRGAENVPRVGGVLICPNHVSDADAPAVALTLPRDAYYMAKAQLFDLPVLGPLMRLFGGFPVRRGSADRTALRQAEALLKAGEAVVIFPEGGGNAENTLQPLFAGPLLLALRTRVPVIPVAIRNSGKMWTHGAPLPRRSEVPVTVTYGEPLDLSDLYGRKDGPEAATRRLTEHLAAMLGQPIPTGRPPERD
ncbi:MAG: lysophospholipid acyltransferase family protein [Capsulimonadales bacterium]|nr:lysophospholipid acyltransferase family protein [Capsulimonadales bacterium]